MPARSRFRRLTPFEGTLTCAHCSATFTARQRNHTYCSISCSRAARTIRERVTRRAERTGRNARRRARRFGGRVVAYDRTSIFERDGWICALCGGPIAPELRYPNPLSPSIDHAELLADGGDDAPWNVRSSHLRCNLRRQRAAA